MWVIKKFTTKWVSILEVNTQRNKGEIQKQ